MKKASLTLLQNLKAVFFDLDDVLVFSETTHTKAWKKALPEFGIDPQRIDFQSMVGMSDLLQARLFIERYYDQKDQVVQNQVVQTDPTLLWELKRKTFLDMTKEGFESAGGRNALLQALSATYQIGVVSSSSRKIVQEVLQLEKIADYFHFIIGFEDCVKHKPDPLPYQNALKKAEIYPHEALVVEDSVNGIRAAQNASIPVIGLLKDQRPDQILEGIQYFNDFASIHSTLFPELLL